MHPLSPKSRSRSGYGFTLVEIIVVIIIVAILAAILVPVFLRSKSKSRQATCLSNLRQMSNAWLLYTQDADQMTIPWSVSGRSASDAFAWDQLIKAYQKSDEVQHCPDGGDTPMTYTYNACVGGATCGSSSDPAPAPPPRSLASLQNAPETPMIAECLGAIAMPDPADKTANWSFSFICPDEKRAIQARGLRHGTGSDEWVRWNNNHGFNKDINAAATIFPTRHQSGANYVFADGHAKWVQAEQGEDGTPIPPRKGMDYDSDGTLGGDPKAGTEGAYD